MFLQMQTLLYNFHLPIHNLHHNPQLLASYIQCNNPSHQYHHYTALLGLKRLDTKVLFLPLHHLHCQDSICHTKFFCVEMGVYTFFLSHHHHKLFVVHLHIIPIYLGDGIPQYQLLLHTKIFQMWNFSHKNSSIRLVLLP